jgi:transcriptional regulator with XRE-family HTH domain
LGFAENLKRLRRERFWSQDELAKRSGVARQTIYRYESRLSAPYARTVRALAEAFGLGPHELANPSEVAEEKQEKRTAA